MFFFAVVGGYAGFANFDYFGLLSNDWYAEISNPAQGGRGQQHFCADALISHNISSVGPAGFEVQTL